GNSSLSQDQLANWLLTKFRGGVDSERIPADRTQAQGEALLANLNQFLYKKYNQSSEFPRKDAALSIIFISDENDVCFDYAAANAGGLNLKPNFADRANGKTDQNGITRDLPEHNSFYSDAICKYEGRRIDHKL